MTKYTIEKIAGKEMTVVWFVSEEERERSDFCGDRFHWSDLQGGIKILQAIDHIATALPALPKHPKPEDAALLYRYMAEGVIACYGVYNSSIDRWICGETLIVLDMLKRGILDNVDEFEMARDKDGNRIEVAIKEQNR